MPDETELTPLEMAEALDDMDRDLSSDNADFLQKVLGALTSEEKLKPKELTRLRSLYEKYFGESEEEENEDPNDPPEDDFV